MKTKRFLKYFILIFSVLCILAFTGCDRNKIATPENISIDDDNNLIWNSVEEARSYEISFLFVDTNEEFTDNTRKTVYSLNNLSEGDYVIKIKSVAGEKGKKDSNYSSEFEYHKYYETGCIYQKINNDTEYQILKVGKASGVFEIEDYYRGKAVTQIANGAFKGSSRITNVTIGSNVISIGEMAFYNCSKLVEVVIPSSVTSIGKACFQSCRSLTTVNIPDTVDVIPEFCFAYCRSLASIELNNNIEILSESCFQDCSSLIEIVIPDSVKTLGVYGFSACSKLEKITFGANLTSIPDYAFFKCSALKELVFSSNSHIDSIGREAFSYCDSLVNIVLPDGLTKISDYCFYNSKSLETITIPLSVSEVGSFCFNKTKLYDDALAKNDDFIYADNWLVGCNPTTHKSIEDINTDTLKNTIVGIANSVFAGAAELKSVVLSSSFKYIGEKAFQSCPKLWKFKTLDDSIEVIGDYAFTNCVLTNITLGVGLKRIGSYAFYGNPQLDNNKLSPTSWIPESVTSIGTYAFKETKLWNEPRDGDGIVYAGNWVVGINGNTQSGIVLNVDKKRVAGIADYAFYKCDTISSITGLVNCRYIGRGAFQGCTSLASVSLNNNLTEIRDRTFYECDSLLSITFPKSLLSIGQYAFYKCTKLTAVLLAGTNCKTIGKGAFYRCGNIQELTFGNKLVSIGDYAFNQCTRIPSITFTEKVEEIGVKSFYKCNFLTELVFNDLIKSIPEGAFNGCIRLNEINLPDSIEKIGKSAFYKCENVSKLTLGKNVNYIGDYAFFGCEKIEEMKLPSALTFIGNYAFKGLKDLSFVVIPDTVKYIGQHVFYGCDSLTIYTNANSLLGEWHTRFNSGFCPVFWGAELDENLNVVSINVTKELFEYKIPGRMISAPVKDGKHLICWVDEANDVSYNDMSGFNKLENCKLVARYEN